MLLFYQPKFFSSGGVALKGLTTEPGTEEPIPLTLSPQSHQYLQSYPSYPTYLPKLIHYIVL